MVSKTTNQRNIFFSRDRETAMQRLKRLAKEDKYYQSKSVRMSKKQIPHVSGWKTWKIVKSK